MLNIYKITRKDMCRYDEFQSIVIVAESEREAIKTLPCGCPFNVEPLTDSDGFIIEDCQESHPHSWIYRYWQPDNLVVTHVGLALPGVTGIIETNYIRG